jgi:hypothetical protein
MTNLSDIKEAAEDLSVDELEHLVEVLCRLIFERNQAQISREVAAAKADHQQDRPQPETVGLLPNGMQPVQS